MGGELAVVVIDPLVPVALFSREAQHPKDHLAGSH